MPVTAELPKLFAVGVAIANSTAPVLLSAPMMVKPEPCTVEVTVTTLFSTVTAILLNEPLFMPVSTATFIASAMSDDAAGATMLAVVRETPLISKLTVASAEIALPTVMVLDCATSSPALRPKLAGLKPAT